MNLRRLSIDDNDVFGVGDRDPIFRIELINQDPRICK